METNYYVNSYLVFIVAMVFYSFIRAYYENVIENLIPRNIKSRFKKGNLLIGTKPHPVHGDRSYMSNPIRIMDITYSHIIYQVEWADKVTRRIVGTPKSELMTFDDAIGQSFVPYPIKLEES